MRLSAALLLWSLGSAGAQGNIRGGGVTRPGGGSTNGGGGGPNQGGGKFRMTSSCRYLTEIREMGGNSTMEVEEGACEMSAEEGDFLGGRIVSIPKDMVKEMRAKAGGKGLVSGNTMVFHPHADIDTDMNMLVVPPGDIAGLSVLDGDDDEKELGRRRLAVTVGGFTVLVVRVIATDGETEPSEGHLGDSVFGTYGGNATWEDQVNLASQYRACSDNQLEFNPAENRDLLNDVDDGDETGINNGVTTVRVDVSTTEGDSTMRNAINAELEENFGTSARNLANFVMQCLPPGTMNGIAYAYVNHWLSVYSNQWCTYPSGQLHEIGHNLNLAHSGEGNEQYADQSGFMGYSYSQDEQRMCFNAPKFYQLNWFPNHHKDINAVSESWSGELFGFAAYNTVAENDVMFVRLYDPSCSTCDIYISFNWKDANINPNTAEGANQVLIHKKEAGINDYKQSWLISKLNAGQSYTHDFGIYTRKITVNSISGNKANIRIGCDTDEDCSDGNACTIDTCNTSTGSCELPVDDSENICPNDSDSCNGYSVCLPETGTCQNLSPEEYCDDSNPCTDDICDNGAPGGCYYVDIPNCLAGGALLETWENIDGSSVSDLTTNSNFPNNPSSFQVLTTGVEAETNRDNRYGARLRTYIQAPETGDYTFWIASDDASELWLSDSTNPANKAKIAEVTGWVPPNTWVDDSPAMSNTIALEAGKLYYLEALHKEGGGGDNLSVAWRYGSMAKSLISEGNFFYPKLLLGLTDPPSPVPTLSSTLSPTTATPTASLSPTISAAPTILGMVGETGRIQVSTATVTVLTRHSYEEPVVVAFINSREEADSVDVRVKDVTSDSFSLFLEEPQGQALGTNPAHGAETMSYIVMEAGWHELEGGLIVQAGLHETARVRRKGDPFDGDLVTFAQPFNSKPAVLTTLNTYNNEKFMTTLNTKVQPNQFKISQEALETSSPSELESIGWMAFSTGSGVTAGSPYISNYAESDGTSNGVGQTAYTISYTAFTSEPDLVVSLIGENGKDGSYARGAGTFSTTSQTVYAEEDQNFDTERGHISEPFAWVGFEHNTNLIEVPVTDYPTPSPTISLTDPPTGASYYLACGSTGTSCSGQVITAPPYESHEVRCCSETGQNGWQKASHCDVWGESDLQNEEGVTTCYNGETYASAVQICALNNARLCTVKELQDDCTRGSGCGHDSDYIWSSDIEVPTLSPTPVPTSTPVTSEPTSTGPPTRIGAIGETGRVLIDSYGLFVHFRYTYVDPVVVAFVNTRNGRDSVDVRVKDVTSRMFTIFLEEPPSFDGQHPFAEEVSYIVMEKGTHTLAGGMTIEAGSHFTSKVHRGGEGFVGDQIAFVAPFVSTPAVLATLNTYNNGQFMTSLTTNVGTNTFEIGQEALETGSDVANEEIGWIAFEQGSNPGDFIAGYAPSDGEGDGVGQTGFTIDISAADFTELPDLVANVYGENGKDGSYARGAGMFTTTTQKVYAEEDTMMDSEQGHDSEPFAWVGFSHESDLFAEG